MSRARTLALACIGLLCAPRPAWAQGSLPAGFVERRWGRSEANRCVPDVEDALARLPVRGEPLGFVAGGEGAFHPVLRHWQGIQRLAVGDGRWLLGTRNGGGTGFVVVRMASRDASGSAFRSSRLRGGWPEREVAPPPMDRVTVVVTPEPGLDHAGGPQLAGHLLAVPYESRGDSSIVVFYDLGDPAAPRRLGALRRGGGGARGEVAHASLAALARLADRRWLLVVGARSSKMLSFHVSRDTTLAGAPAFERLAVSTDGVEGGFQNLNLVTQCDGALYLIGMHNTGFPPPSLGQDHLHWYALEAGPEGLRLAERGGMRVECVECNFGAGAGVYVTPEGHLVLYGIGRGLGGPGASAQVEEFAPGPAG